eukprot:2275063-Pyramimonas_sp.AAC.1
MLACNLQHTTDTLSIAGGMIGKTTIGNVGNMLGHVRVSGKCKFAKPWKLLDSHGQAPLAPAESAAPPPEAQAAPPFVRLRAQSWTHSGRQQPRHYSRQTCC